MILYEIAEKTKERVEHMKNEVPLEEVRRKALSMPVNKEFSFYEALKKDSISKDSISFICEVKKASPSKGIIVEDFPYLEIAKEYEEAGADAISCLTEPYYFQGSDSYLKEIAESVSVPVLKKDFIVDEYQIYQAKLQKAAAVLLICSLLETQKLKEYLELAHSLGMAALVEAHDEEEIQKALSVGAKTIGVNNRDLKTFTVDIQNSARLRKLVPKEVLFVSESGMKTPEDIESLRQMGVNGVLIGETLMRQKDKKAALNYLRYGRKE